MKKVSAQPSDLLNGALRRMGEYVYCHSYSPVGTTTKMRSQRAKMLKYRLTVVLIAGTRATTYRKEPLPAIHTTNANGNITMKKNLSVGV